MITDFCPSDRLILTPQFKKVIFVQVLGYICSLEVLLCSLQSYRAAKYHKMEESSTNFTLHDTANNPAVASRAVTADSIGPPRPHPPPAPRPIVRSQAANRTGGHHHAQPHTTDLMSIANQNYRPATSASAAAATAAAPQSAFQQRPHHQQHVVHYQLHNDQGSPDDDLLTVHHVVDAGRHFNAESSSSNRRHPMLVDERLAAVLLKGSASPDSPPSMTGRRVPRYMPAEAGFMSREDDEAVAGGYVNRPLAERFTDADPQPDSFYDFR